jgi:NADPH-dependent curcumin reductase CurA
MQALIQQDLNVELDHGGLVVETIIASFDPSLRGRMRDPEIKWAYPAFVVSEPIETYLLAKVLNSKSTRFAPGDIVHGLLPIQKYTRINMEVATALEKIDNSYTLDLKLFVGPLGMPGLTAYSSLYGIGKPKKGETIFISSAAGAVGQVVGQLAKREGLRVIGSVGGQAKLDFILGELGFDAGFVYQETGTSEQLKKLAPEGLDIYYDNVGGEQLEAALYNMKIRGRIGKTILSYRSTEGVCLLGVVASGMMSQYSKSREDQYNVRSLMEIVTSRLTIQGFVWNDPDMGPKYASEHQKNLQEWLHEGSIKASIDVTDGIDQGGKGLVRMLTGKNFGKAVLIF